MADYEGHNFPNKESTVIDSTSLFRLDGKVALVTGGSRGLGREIATTFAKNGADVVITSRDEHNCVELASEIEATCQVNAFPYAAHIGHWDEIDGLVDAAYDRFGHVDILVNNAGMSPIYDTVVDVTESLFDKVLDVNLKGPFRLTALVGTRMAEDQGGSIINISSVGAVHPRPAILPYAAAKAGLNAITAGFARAFGPSVRCNAIMAGTFLTDISKSWDAVAFAERARTFALERGGRPDEIVGAALYLASAASSYTTGSILTVDGGQP
jgi:NAD(P)-dependent dehydrogenase (short-subunit alcohol dehydrogenase family)